MPNPIEPTVGRIVLVRAASICGGRELPGIVVRVWSHDCINVAVFRDDHDAPATVLTSVPYRDDDEPPTWASWRWMPYQVAKAAEHAPAPEPVREALKPGDRVHYTRFADLGGRVQNRYDDLRAVLVCDEGTFWIEQQSPLGYVILGERYTPKS